MTWDIMFLTIVNFNPRSRVGSDMKSHINEYRRMISIRAPAWGATMAGEKQVIMTGISIRAPAWGATR